MADLIDGDDGLPAVEVGAQAKDKHEYLSRYVDITRSVRTRWTGPGKAGATYIDLYCGPGRCLVKETGEWIDGGAVVAWKKSVEGGQPFTKMFVGDLAESRSNAAANRLRRLGAPVVELSGPAAETVKVLLPLLNPYGLHFAFLDPYSLKALDFEVVRTLSTLGRIDMLVHLSQMDLQRNLRNYIDMQDSPFDAFAPGWRDHVDPASGQEDVRNQIITYWRDCVANLGVWPSFDMKLVRGSRKQPLYWLLVAAKHKLAHDLWAKASAVSGQGALDL